MPISEELRALQFLVAQNDHCLTDSVVSLIVDLHKRSKPSELRAISPLYAFAEDSFESNVTSVEYYRIVDNKGSDTSTTLRHKPEIPLWTKSSSSYLFIANWLAHTIGLRHTSVHLFLETSPPEKFVLLQLRSFDHIGEPGKFDLPVAGHVSENEDPKISIKREMNEELGLDADVHLVDGLINNISAYPYKNDNPSQYRIRVEWRVVYSATLTKSALNYIHFDDREVSGVTLLDKETFEKFLRFYDGNIASGLRFSAPYYIDQN